MGDIICPAAIDQEDPMQSKIINQQQTIDEFKMGVETRVIPIRHTQNVLGSKGAHLATKLSEIIKKLEQKQGLYEDPDYETPTTIPLQASNSETMSYFTWKRIYDIIPDPIIVKENSKMNLIVKNSDLGYFQIFLEFLSNFPKLINDNIFTRQNTYGLYIIKIFLNGVQTEMIIDDKILVKREDGSPAFIETGATGNQIWPYIYEKAWMKIRRDIPCIVNHHPKPLDPFKWFTNIPSRDIILKLVSKQNFRNFIHNNPQSYFYYFRSHSNTTVKIGIPASQYFTLVNINKQDNLYYFKSTTGAFTFRGKHADKQTAFSFPLEFEQIFEQFSICTTLYYYRGFKHTSIPIASEVTSEEVAQVFIQFRIRQSLPTSIRIIKQQNDSHPLMIDLIDLQENRLVSTGSLTSMFEEPETNVFNDVVSLVSQGNYLLRLCYKPIGRQRITPINSTVVFYGAAPLAEFEVNTKFSQEFNNYLLERCEQQFENRSISQGNHSFSIVQEDNRNIIFIKRTFPGPEPMKISLKFLDKENLKCRSHQQSKTKVQVPVGEKVQEKEYDFLENLELKDSIMIVLEKIDLGKGTKLVNIQFDCE